MLKLLYVIIANLHRAPYMIPSMRYRADHPEKYSEEQRYSLAHHVIYLMNKTGKITFGVGVSSNITKASFRGIFSALNRLTES